MDRASSTTSAHPPSPRLFFAKWEGNASSLRAHFRALGSKIVDLFRESVSLLPVCIILELWLFTARDSGPDARTLSGFIEFRDLDTAKEALARFNGPGLSLAYSRPRDDQKAKSGSKRKGSDWRDPVFGLVKERFERDDTKKRY